MGARALVSSALVWAVLVSATPPATAAAATPVRTEAQQIIAIAKRQLGDHWRSGAIGPGAFDCSGLVLYSYRKAGDARVLGKGRLRSARAMYAYFRAHGKASRTNPKPGDLVIWGRGTHVGIYIGHGKAISTLTTGVRIHRVHAVTARFTTYLHTGVWKTPVRRAAPRAAAATPTPVPTPIPSPTAPSPGS
jgi:cell wall-associated NlpC family hydrolase